MKGGRKTPAANKKAAAGRRAEGKKGTAAKARAELSTQGGRSPAAPTGGKLWGGRFRQAPAAEFERFSESFSFDVRLALAEVRGTRAQTRSLERAGVLSASEAGSVQGALDRLEAEWEAEAPSLADAPGIEDVHTFVFQRIEELAGTAARKLQTGRSRNEQVALDLRLYLLQMRPALREGLGLLIAGLADFADRHAEVLIPGYTHLQRAQPISIGHHALAFAEMLLRDAGRLEDAYKRIEVSPLGSGALAGTPWKTDREAAARELQFGAAAHAGSGERPGAVTRNSLDAVGDRDFAVETTFVLSLMGVHLSRLAEDWILYSSSEFGWLAMSDAYATGSSLMPQKKNADALELMRGKSARQIGNLMSLLTLLKGLPTAYNRDLQEDKEPLFDALDTALGCLHIATGVVESVEVDAARAREAVGDAALLATDLADVLVEAGVPFHDAHAATGRLIASAADGRRDFRKMTDAELQAGLGLRQRQGAGASGADFVALAAKIRGLSAKASVARRNCVGGTAVGRVRAEAARVGALAALMVGQKTKESPAVGVAWVSPAARRLGLAEAATETRKGRHGGDSGVAGAERKAAARRARPNT